VLNRVVERFRRHERLDVLGGPNVTPPESGFSERVYGAVMCSPLIAPKIYRRYSAGRRAFRLNATDDELILCNLAVRREGVPPTARFRARLSSNEENLFLNECARNRCVIGWDPDIG